jgi:hypothetical protein
MTPDRDPVQGWAWYASKLWSLEAKTARDPFEGLAKRPKVRLLCPVRTSVGIGNRFPDDKSTGWLLVTESPTAPQVGEAWRVEPAELEPGFTAGPVRLVRVVRTEQNHWGQVQECLLTEGPEKDPTLLPRTLPVESLRGLNRSVSLGFRGR